METKRLYKSTQDKAIFGVCGGIAEYFEIDSLIVRLIVVLFALAGGSGLLAYIAAALIIPNRPKVGWQQLDPQPSQPGAYNVDGATYVNRAALYEEEDASQEFVAEDAPFVQPEVQPRSFYEASAQQQFHETPHRTGSGRVGVGALLLLAGIYVLLRVILPHLDPRIWLAAGLILAGIFLLSRGK